HTFVAADLARVTGRPVRCALTRREEHTSAGNRNATIQRLRAGARSDGTIVALAGEFTNSVGWSGWSAPTEGPMQMLYDCDNVRTVTYGAKVNTPPMKAFRAPGFVEGTFGLECLIDGLAARLDVDPLELRRRNYASSNEGTPFSSKNLEECYRRAEPHWERRHEVRARSDAVWKRGVGMASQIWYGGGGPPSYAWVRLGSDGRATVVTAMQDIGTGTRTAMAQIAAEELRVPLENVDVVTGEVRVERVAAIHDVGRIVNPLGASSQVEGGVIQGVGHTLSEERLLDPETGRVLTTSLDAYRMPTIADVPEIVCEFVDKPDEHLTNLGSKGLGEPPIVPIAAAIANAIRDATGAEVHELPISREEMLRALREAAKKERRGAPAAV